MTGVLEVAAAASAIAAFARSRHEKERTEEKVAADLYARFFHADLLDVSPDRASTTSSERFQNLDANAAAAVRAIERYQKATLLSTGACGMLHWACSNASAGKLDY
ncbi:unnamed protein product [Polarella glacialis]|uniref:Uncharacterized protein n=1 Tax=Polarella glacialis TaxID=89957 RepID=A0A813FFY9_POLGL|nr:unnamed protein product [Polarella glacialis]